jgi:phosphoribosylformylglycinamidine synthase
MKFGIVVFPGSNCDQDTYQAVKQVTGQEAEYIWHKDTKLAPYDCIILPGGFSYGDYLRTGAIARFSPIMRGVISFAQRGGLVFGICNGFQILLESGLLPGTMMKNRTLQFICKDVYIKVEKNTTPFTVDYEKNQVITLPIAHSEGNYYTDPKTLEELEINDQIVFRYVSPEGKIEDAWNPNGSLHNIAGISNKGGNVVGLMPHPERNADSLIGDGMGAKVFSSILHWAGLTDFNL